MAELRIFWPALIYPRRPCPFGVPDSLSERVNVIVAKLVQGFSGLAAGFGIPALAPVPVRGDVAGLATYEIVRGNWSSSSSRTPPNRSSGQCWAC